jgi:hypothetical protein
VPYLSALAVTALAGTALDWRQQPSVHCLRAQFRERNYP